MQVVLWHMAHIKSKKGHKIIGWGSPYSTICSGYKDIFII